MSEAKDESRSTAKLESLEEAIGAYWDCAYQEGHTGRPDGNKANAILHEIRESVSDLIEQEREACAVVAEESSPRHTECGRKIAHRIRMRSNDIVRGA